MSLCQQACTKAMRRALRSVVGAWFRCSVMALSPPMRPVVGRTGPTGRHAMRAPNLPVLFHPDFNRRLRNRTESADPADCSAGARGLWRSLAITAGGDFHPAPRTRSDRNPTDAINTPLAKPRNDFPPARLHGFGVREVTDRARWLERRDKNLIGLLRFAALPCSTSRWSSAHRGTVR